MKAFKLFVVSSLVSVSAFAARIDKQKVLLGMEPTFQDQGMVDEPGRMTFSTPHKRAKFDAMITAVLENIGETDTAKKVPTGSAHSKPGYQIIIPGRQGFVVDMEPVCVEWNNGTMKLDEVVIRWTPVYKAAAQVGLVPYVNPAAERSGMGHIHIGGATIGENPFFEHPLLLRNTMVYLHKHPSLLWGFGEAYDIGVDSNIESYHDERQEKFKKAVESFDRWYAKASPAERVDGAFKFLGFLKENDNNNFFRHYRFINLEHVASLANKTMAEVGAKGGKYTIEFRNIRPYKSPKHAQKMAGLLFDVMEQMSNPKLIVPFETISPARYANFHSSTVTAADWENVKSELKLKNDALVEEMIGEYVQNQESKAVESIMERGLRFAPAYSQKGKKGRYVEIRLPADQSDWNPSVEIAGVALEFERVTVQGKDYWVAVAQTNDLGVEAEDVISGRALKIEYSGVTCRALFGR